MGAKFRVTDKYKQAVLYTKLRLSAEEVTSRSVFTRVVWLNITTGIG